MIKQLVNSVAGLSDKSVRGATGKLTHGISGLENSKLIRFPKRALCQISINLTIYTEYFTQVAWHRARFSNKTLFSGITGIFMLVCLLMTGPGGLISFGQTPGKPTGLVALTGLISSELKQPVRNATISLLRVDSTLILTTQSDSGGHFNLINVQSGQYLMRITHVGLQPIFQTLTASDTAVNASLSFTMSTKVSNLAEVMVKEKRPAIELLGDRIILNIEGNPIYSGGTTLDLLSLAPRLAIDVINKKIAIDDKPGAVLYQDNRQLYMPSEQIVPYLQSLPASSIARIEILTNPSARYDANTGGVILLFTKAFYRQGTSADVALTGGFGRYPKANASLALSVQKNKLQGKLLYTPSYRPTYFQWNSYQTLAPLQSGQSGFSSGDQFNKEDINSHLFRTNWDLQLSKQQSVGVVLFVNQISDTQNPSSTLEYRLATPSARLTRINSTSQLRSRQLNLSANLNYQLVFANPKTTLSVDADVAQYTDNSRSRADFTPFADQPLPSESLLIHYPNSIGFQTAKVDFATGVFSKGALETGLKFSSIDLQNNPQLMLATPGFDALKPDLVRAFQYDETTSAAYGSLSYEWKQVSMRAGLRLEHTHYVASVNRQDELIRDYTNAFPTINLQYSTTKKFQYSLNVNRRINRPAFDVLNPSYIFYDPLTLYTGNPLLLPQLSTSIQLGLVTPKRVSLSLSYNYSQNRITEILYRTDSLSASILNYYINFNWEKRLSVILSVPLQLRPFWRLQGTITGLISRNLSTFEQVPIVTAQPTGVLRLLNTFNAKKFSATLNFTYRNTAVVGYLKFKPLWYLDAGLQYSINDQSALKLSASDIFHTLLLQNYGTYLNTSVAYNHRSETQQLLLSYTFKFGHTKARPVNERELGSESEQQRLGGKR